MSLKALCRGLLAVVALAALAGGAFAQTMFYNEVAKDGRIYVFASGQRFDAFEKSGGAEIGVAITRPGYGPNGETVVFDSEDAINLYNYKHGLPGRVLPEAEGSAEVAVPGRQVHRADVRGLLLVRQVAPGRDQRHQPEQRAAPAGLLAAARLLHLRLDDQ